MKLADLEALRVKYNLPKSPETTPVPPQLTTTELAMQCARLGVEYGESLRRRSEHRG